MAFVGDRDKRGETLLSGEGTRGMGELLGGEALVYRTFRPGDVVDGVIVGLDRDGILVDIGSKSEGIVPAYEAQRFSQEAPEGLKVGEEVLVYVLQPENEEGNVILSLDRARAERSWRKVQHKFEEGELFEAEVVDHNKGGLIVNVEGLRGFVPTSQVAGLRPNGSEEEEREGRQSEYVGKTLRLKVIEMNRRRNRIILSERAAFQEWRSERRDRLVEELREGEVRTGRVSSLCTFGAFVDLGGADGLVHLSELSWEHVNHPSEVLKVGQEVSVYVLGVDRESKRIALSIRRTQPEPWLLVSDKYHEGEVVTGTITKLTSFGAFARVEEGVEGLIHLSELSDKHIEHPRQAVKVGDVLRLKVVKIDPERRRLGLSLRQMQEEEEESEVPIMAEDFEEESAVAALSSEPAGAGEPVSEVERGPREGEASE